MIEVCTSLMVDAVSRCKSSCFVEVEDRSFARAPNGHVLKVLAEFIDVLRVLMFVGFRYVDLTA